MQSESGTTVAKMIIKLFTLRKSSIIQVAVLCCGVIVLGLASGVDGLKCYCDPKECDVIRPSDCPGKGIIVKDPCKCCDVCSKTEGEECGGPGNFSGNCEPPLLCVSTLPITEPGVCKDIHKLIHPDSSCPVGERIEVAVGCLIANKRCKCFNKSYHCSNSLHHTWDFQNLLECHLNLKILLKMEMEFDEDFKVSPSLYDGVMAAKLRLRRRRRRRRKRMTPFQGNERILKAMDNEDANQR